MHRNGSSSRRSQHLLLNKKKILAILQCRYDRIEQQREQVQQRRTHLASILEAQVKDPNTKAGKRRAAAALMATAIGKAWAHQQLLDSHTAQLRHQQEALSRPQNAGEICLSCLSLKTRLGSCSRASSLCAYVCQLAVLTERNGSLASCKETPVQAHMSQKEQYQLAVAFHQTFLCAFQTRSDT